MHLLQTLLAGIPLLGNVVDLLGSLRKRKERRSEKLDLAEFAALQGWPVSPGERAWPSFRVGRTRQRRSPVDLNFMKAHMTVQASYQETPISIGLFEVNYIPVTAYALAIDSSQSFQLVLHRSQTAPGSERPELLGMDMTDFNRSQAPLQAWLAEHPGWGVSLGPLSLICYQFGAVDSNEVVEKLARVLEVSNHISCKASRPTAHG